MSIDKSNGNIKLSNDTQYSRYLLPLFPSLFQPLSQLTDQESAISPPPAFKPKASSTPKKDKNKPTPPQGQKKQTVTNLVINFQSLKNKIHVFSSSLSLNPTDIIFGTETWLHKQIEDAELHLGEYDLYRNERPGNSKIDKVDFGNLSEEERREK